MSDLVTWLRAQVDEDEQHARKDLWALDRATSHGDWEIHYGYNLPYSVIMAGEVEVGRLTQHLHVLPVGAEDAHAADGLLVGRAVRTLRRRAERALAEVDAKRRILDWHDAALANRTAYPDDVAGAGWLLAMVKVVKLMALPYVDRSGYEEAWRP